MISSKVRNYWSCKSPTISSQSVSILPKIYIWRFSCRLLFIKSKTSLRLSIYFYEGGRNWHTSDWNVLLMCRRIYFIFGNKFPFRDTDQVMAFLFPPSSSPWGKQDARRPGRQVAKTFRRGRPRWRVQMLGKPSSSFCCLSVLTQGQHPDLMGEDLHALNYISLISLCRSLHSLWLTCFYTGFLASCSAWKRHIK